MHRRHTLTASYHARGGVTWDLHASQEGQQVPKHKSKSKPTKSESKPTLTSVGLRKRRRPSGRIHRGSCMAPTVLNKMSMAFRQKHGCENVSSATWESGVLGKSASMRRNAYADNECM